MGVKVATTCFQLSQPIIPHSLSSSQTLASAVSSPSSKRGGRSEKAAAAALFCRYVNRVDRSALFRTRSCEFPKSNARTIKRACSASLDAYSDEEFSKKIQELALRFQLADDNDSNSEKDSESESVSSNIQDNSTASHIRFSVESVEPPWLEDDNDSASIERKANSVEIPLSLRMIKRKLQWQKAGESAYCSVKKAFSSMVFIIRELQSYTLQMRELLYTEDLQGILVRVQKEMHASFVWLFQQVFSHTPALMVSVMILLANFTVYSMSSNAAIAAAPPHYPAATECVSFVETQDRKNPNFDSSSVKSFSASSSLGKSTSIGGNNGGGSKIRPVASGTDGDGWFDRSNQFRTIVPDGAHQLSSLGTTREAESFSGQESREEELSLWNSIVEEASRMQDAVRDESLDQETRERLVSPVTAKMEADDYADYFRTELLYQTGLAQDPTNALLLANYAQFLYLVAHDYDRAEEYFKRAIKVEPPDAEAYSKYASFLWRARNDLWAAEETFLEAISADPSNSYYAANYAHFLWNTGGEDTCFPLSSPEADSTQEV